MTVQDDERERELVRIFNLVWDPSHKRGGVDANLNLEVNGQNYSFEVEVKSSTTSSVSTARDVGIQHIVKWRRKFFVIGFYSREKGRPELQRCLCLTPNDMDPWIKTIEDKIRIDFELATCASEKLELADLFKLCGKKDMYKMADAKLLHKQQWDEKQYKAGRDMIIKNSLGYSPNKMLEILRLRSKYISERGATLNNPHITKTHLEKFFGTESEPSINDCAATIRKIAKDFLKLNPKHEAVTKI